MYINVSECPTEILIRLNTSKWLKWEHNKHNNGSSSVQSSCSQSLKVLL